MSSSDDTRGTNHPEENRGESAVSVDPSIASAFFTELERRCDKKIGRLGTNLENSIADHPALLCIKFQHKDYGQVTATEFICCHRLNTSCRDLLFDLISRGAKATYKCYEEAIEYYNFIECLLLSGYMPTDFRTGKKFLDCMMEDHSYMKDDKETNEDILRLLLGQVKPGDQFSFGEVTEVHIENLKNLPKLNPGVTHAKGGSFDDALKEYLRD
jgi:hypothetical protein